VTWENLVASVAAAGPRPASGRSCEPWGIQHYIWDRLAAAGVSFRNYGFSVNNVANQFVADDPVLNANTDHNFRGVP
jgi:hypothetical protein